MTLLVSLAPLQVGMAMHPLQLCRLSLAPLRAGTDRVTPEPRGKWGPPQCAR